MRDATAYLASALALLAAGYKLVWGRPSPALRCLCGFFICLGIAMTVMAPTTMTLVSRFEPVPNLSRLTGNALEMSAAMFLALLARAVQAPSDTLRFGRQQAGVLAGVIAVMTVLLIAGRTEFTPNFVNQYSGNPFIVSYEILFFSYVAWCLITFIRLLAHFARHAGSGALNVGLRLTIAGAGFGLLWVAWSGVRPGITFSTGRRLETAAPVGVVLGACCLILFLAGAVLAAWGGAVIGWLAAYRRYRALRPLWSALRAALPEIALAGPVTLFGLPRDARFALYRRIVEIRDGLLILREHVPPLTEFWINAADPGGDPRTAPVQAARIAAALVAHEIGDADIASQPGPGHEMADEVEPTIEAEAAWLAAVSHAFATSPSVRYVRERMRVDLAKPH